MCLIFSIFFKYEMKQMHVFYESVLVAQSTYFLLLFLEMEKVSKENSISDACIHGIEKAVRDHKWRF